MLKRTLLIVVVAGFALSLALTFNFIVKIPGLALFIENAGALPTQEEERYGLPASPARLPDGQVGRPMRLKIPGIKVDSAVEYVSLTPDGAMDVPKERANTAWFELGPRPGESGHAVIVGHYGRENKEGSVFDNLHKLRKGDKLYVEDDKGMIITFIVRESRRYDSKADTSVFGQDDGKAHLNLITCEGIWDENTQQYPKRLVVFADKEVD